MGLYDNKKIIIIGDRDGIPAPAVEECLKNVPCEIIYSATECFVWTAAGAMDLENQNRVKNAVDQYGADNVIVLLGAAEGEASGLAAETVTNGDPTFSGSLTGVQLGLRCFHVFEEEFKDAVDPSVYDEQIGMMEMVSDVDGIISEMKSIREQFCKFN